MGWVGWLLPSYRVLKTSWSHPLVRDQIRDTSDFKLQTSNFKLQTSNFKLQTSNYHRSKFQIFLRSGEGVLAEHEGEYQGWGDPQGVRKGVVFAPWGGWIYEGYFYSHEKGSSQEALILDHPLLINPTKVCYNPALEHTLPPQRYPYPQKSSTDQGENSHFQ
eukprot:765925-Hanusia_phi.AAC.1